MNKTIRKVLGISWKFIKKNLPTIMVTLGVVGTGAAGYFYAKGAEKKEEYLEEAIEDHVMLTKNDKIKAAIDAFIIPVGIHALSIALIITGNAMHVRKELKLSEAYMALDSMFKAYKLKTNDIYGPDATDNIEKSIMLDKYKSDPEWQLRTDEVLFYDMYTEQYFEASMEDFMEARAALNCIFNRYGRAYLSNFYPCIPGFPNRNYDRTLGWDGNMIPSNDYIHINIEPCIIKDREVYPDNPKMDGLRCYVISMPIYPDVIDY